MLVFDFLRVVINKYGMWGSIFLTTVFAVIMSVAFTGLILATTEISQINNRIISGMLTAALVALLLTPLISFGFFRLIRQLDTAEVELRVLAQTDSLTGVMNRRYFSEVADQVLQNIHSYPISVILVDMNYFKQVNDSFGHLIGDRMLITFCDLVRGAIREFDIFGRFGGDEFALLLPRTDQEQVIGVLNRISSELALLEIEADDGRKVDISVSVGVFSVENDTPCNLENLIRQADLALYEAKEKSRNSEGILFYSTIMEENLKY